MNVACDSLRVLVREIIARVLLRRPTELAHERLELLGGHGLGDRLARGYHLENYVQIAKFASRAVHGQALAPNRVDLICGDGPLCRFVGNHEFGVIEVSENALKAEQRLDVVDFHREIEIVVGTQKPLVLGNVENNNQIAKYAL